MRKMLVKRQKVWMICFAFLYLGINIWILCRLRLLEEYTDLIALSCPAGSITESAFDQWREHADSGRYSEAAVWRKTEELEVVAEDTGRSRKMFCYRIKGQPGAVFGRGLTEGRYFIEGETGICLLEQGTARQLFGADQVSGLTVQIDGNDYRIAGILQGNEPICIIPAEEGETFDGIAVRKKDAGQSSNKAVSSLESALGCTGGQEIDGKLFYVTAWLLYAGLAAAALFLMGNAAVSQAGSRLADRIPPGQMKTAARTVIMILAIGVLVSGVMTADPGSDYLPTYWSDFEFFARLFHDKEEQIRSLSMHLEFASWISMIKAWRQAAAAGLLAGSMALALFLSARWRQNIHSTYELEDME